MQRLLSAQHKLHNLEAATLAHAVADVQRCQAQRDGWIACMGGENPHLDLVMAAQLVRFNHVSMRLAELNSIVDRCTSSVARHAQLERQLARLVELQEARDRQEQERLDLEGLIDAAIGRSMLRAT
jgi:hypothetical protein